MATPDAEGERVHQVISRRVRTLRKAKGWTLDQLASLSGVSRSMLSQIERGVANPTLGVTHKIAQALGLSLGQLVENSARRPTIDVIRANDRSHLFRDDQHARIRTLSPLPLEKDVEFYEVRLPARETLGSAPHFKGTREFLTVESGRVQVVSVDESVELSAGDSAHYRADIQHAIENVVDDEALVFLVVIYTTS